MKHLLKYLSLYEQLFSAVLVLCGLSFVVIAAIKLDDTFPFFPALLFSTLTLIILVLAIIAKLMLSDIGTNAIRRGDAVG